MGLCNKIKQQCREKTYQKGEELFCSNKVLSCQVNDTELDLIGISARVKGSNSSIYKVEIALDGKTDDLIDYVCECEAFYTYPGPCKHCVAVAMEYEKQFLNTTVDLPFNSHPKSKPVVNNKNYYTSNVARKLISEYMYKKNIDKSRSSSTGTIELEAVISSQYYGLEVGFRIGNKRMYVIKDLYEFSDAIKHHKNIEYGKQLAFMHMPNVFSDESKELLHFIMDSMQELIYENPLEYSYPSLRRKVPNIKLTPQRLERLMTILVGKKISIKGFGRQPIDVWVEEKDVIVDMHVSKLSEEAYEFVCDPVSYLIGVNHMYMLQGMYIYQCSKEYTHAMKEFWNMLDGEGNNFSFIVTKEYLPSFCSNVLPLISAYINVDAIDTLLENYLPEVAQIAYYIDSKEDFVYVKCVATYGEKEYNLLEEVNTSSSFRNTEVEQEALSVAAQYFQGKDTMQNILVLEDNEDALYELLLRGVTKLNEFGEVFLAEQLKRIKIKRNTKVNVGVALKTNILELHIDSSDVPKEELLRILQNYKKKKKYYRLKNGDFLKLEENALSSLAELSDGLNLKESDVAKGEILIPKYRAFYIDKVLREEETLHFKRDMAFKNLLRDMKSIEDSDFEIPKELEDVLRNYQKVGYRWLRTLEMLGFGGILADDMGLGKTLQIITLLLAKYKDSSQEEKPSLIVCPASLVYNWQNEIAKFAPSLTTQAIVGGVIKRSDALENVEAKVWITSYDLLKRDIDQYKGKEFHYLIIDEAQAIKNQTTLVAKSVKQLNAVTRFALSGTPIENRLSELWSIFDFLMPEFLYSYAKFRKEYESAIVTNQDEKISKRLQRMIKPFILRRVKKDVLKELPDKLETNVYSKMDEEQMNLYQATKAALVESLKKQSKEEFQHGKLKVLAEIMRLRQICCDPSLVYENYSGSSAKLDTCMELIENAINSGHKVLLFSQFTTMLSILASRLEKEGIAYHMLIGATSKEKRMQLVDQFQSDDVPVFLISLKAGGTGLNLTAANIVIHFDPWWNVAVQNQATDRAYRIGQENDVTVYKLITKDTIEEKIIELQEQKKDLANQIISKDGVSVSALSREDFMHLLG